MSDTAANPETGATEAPRVPEGPLTRTSDMADALQGVLSEDDYPDATGPTEATEPETAPEEVKAEAETTEEPADEPEAPSEDEPSEEERGRRYRVKVNGEEKLVTFDELRKGYQMESDYRQKTAQLSDMRKAVEAERQRNADQLGQIIPILQAQVQGEFAGVNWTELASDDPAEYTRLRAAYEERVNTIQMAVAERQYLEQQAMQTQQAEMQEHLQAESKKLVERYPVFGDAEEGPKVRAGVRNFLKREGFTDEQIGGLGDSKLAVVAYKAYLYDKARTDSKKAKTASREVPKVQKAGTPVKTDPNKERASALAERVRETGDSRALADWLSTQEIGQL